MLNSLYKNPINVLSNWKEQFRDINGKIKGETEKRSLLNWERNNITLSNTFLWWRPHKTINKSVVMNVIFNFCIKFFGSLMTLGNSMFLMQMFSVAYDGSEGFIRTRTM